MRFLRRSSLLAGVASVLIACTALTGCSDSSGESGIPPETQTVPEIAADPSPTPEDEGPIDDPHELDVTPDPDVQRSTADPDESDDEPEAAPDAEEPIRRTEVVHFDPDGAPSPERIAEGAPLVTGTVVEVFPPQWSTPDGTRPENPHLQNPADTFIFTPAILELDDAPLTEDDRIRG